MLSDLILNLIDHGHRLIPVDARKVPLIRGWQKAASCDRSVIEDWRRQWAHCDFGLCLTPDEVVTDLDVKRGQDGLGDFRRLDGRDPRDVVTPTSSSPSGGLHLIWATGGRSFKNIRIPNSAIDIKAAGGFVIVPDIIGGVGNGREWLRSLSTTPLAGAPQWLDTALKRPPAPRPPYLPPLSDNPRTQGFACEALARAVTRIAFAEAGQQDAVRHRECFFVGLLVKRGAIRRDEALDALTRAALSMPTYPSDDPWRDLPGRVERSFQSGIDYSGVAR
jgi:hypothetical protein